MLTVIWAEAWDRQEDCADGLVLWHEEARDYRAARAAAGRLAARALALGWAGACYLADETGRLLEELVPAGAEVEPN